MKKQNTIYLGIGIVAIILIAAIVMFSAPKGGETIKIGWIGPLTGPAAFLAQDGLTSAQIAVEQINSKGGILGKKVELLVTDDKYDPKETLSAYEKLVKVDKVDFIMTVQFGIYPDLAKKAKTDNVLLFDALDCNNLITNLGDHVFCLGVESESIARVASDYAKQNNLKKIGVIYFNDDTFMPYVKDHFIKIFEGEVIAEPYSGKDSDFRTTLLKMKNKEVDAIALFGYETLGLAMRQARELGMKVPFMSNTVPESKGLQELSGEAVNGTIFSYWEIETPEREIVQKYYADFEEKKGRKPIINSLAMPHYDTIILLEESIKKAGTTNPEEVKKIIPNISGLEGLTLEINVNEDGGIRIPFEARILILENGTYIPKTVN